MYQNFYHVGVRSGRAGLIVPVIRNVDRLGFAEIEVLFSTLSEKYRKTGSGYRNSKEGPLRSQTAAFTARF